MFAWLKNLWSRPYEEPIILKFPVPLGEQVLCFERRRLDDLGSFQGAIHKQDRISHYYDTLLSDKFLFYESRKVSESDESLKQIIPYILLRRHDNIFRYRRSASGQEERLRGKWSIGLGGHINPIDGEPGHNAYYEGFKRELAEECDCGVNVQPHEFRNTVIGLINDDSNAVGRVHFGIVHQVSVGFVPMTFSDPAISCGSFQHLEVHRTEAEAYENWSKLVIREILKVRYDYD